jgi:predicted AAA+ superfamily ATPase
MGVNKNTLYSYVSMLQDAMFIMSVSQYNPSLRKRELALQKIYLSDVGYSSLIETSKIREEKWRMLFFWNYPSERVCLTKYITGARTMM